MKRQDRFFFCCGLILLASEIWKQWTLTFQLNHGVYNFWYFPFQLCSVPMYVCLILPWIRSGKLYQALLAFLMDFSLLGGIFAFCDTSGMHYRYAPLTVHSFAWHFALIGIGAAAGYVRRKTQDKSPYRGPALCYLACCLIATGLNLFCYQYGSINMFYISPHYPMTQKFFCQLARVIGDPGGIACYIGASLLGGYLIHRLGTTTLTSRSSL